MPPWVLAHCKLHAADLPLLPPYLERLFFLHFLSFLAVRDKAKRGISSAIEGPTPSLPASKLNPLKSFLENFFFFLTASLHFQARLIRGLGWKMYAGVGLALRYGLCGPEGGNTWVQWR